MSENTFITAYRRMAERLPGLLAEWDGLNEEARRDIARGVLELIADRLDTAADLSVMLELVDIDLVLMSHSAGVMKRMHFDPIRLLVPMTSAPRTVPPKLDRADTDLVLELAA